MMKPEKLVLKAGRGHLPPGQFGFAGFSVLWVHRGFPLIKLGFWPKQ